jgi:DNA-binding transcriptional LysR family regulator
MRFLVHAGLGVSLVPGSWLELPGPDVGAAGLAGRAPRHALWLLTRPATLPPAARLLHQALQEV